MTGTPSCPHVFRAINRITAAFAASGIAKTHVNLVDQYQYRSIDDVLNRLSPLLARHRLCVLPRVQQRQELAVRGDFDTELVSVRLEVEFDVVSARDGSRHTVRAWGEALDASDKGTAKAMSAAFKAAMIQVFCIPVSSEDQDRTSLRRKPSVAVPVDGWDCWCAVTIERINSCTCDNQLSAVRTELEPLLTLLQRDRAELYQKIGQGFSHRAAEVALTKAPDVRVSVDA